MSIDVIAPLRLMFTIVLLFSLSPFFTAPHCCAYTCWNVVPCWKSTWVGKAYFSILPCLSKLIESSSEFHPITQTHRSNVRNILTLLTRWTKQIHEVMYPDPPQLSCTYLIKSSMAQAARKNQDMPWKPCRYGQDWEMEHTTCNRVVECRFWFSSSCYFLSIFKKLTFYLGGNAFFHTESNSKS